MVRAPGEALASCAAQSAHGPQFGANECQERAHLAYGIPTDGTPTAAAWWAKSKYRHPTADPSTAPRGAFHYWIGGSSGAGHVTLSRGGASCWSTDIKRSGFYDITTVEHINAAWPQLHYVGWTEDIDGVRVINATPPDPKPLPPEPIPISDRAKVVHRWARRAKANGHEKWSARLLLWAQRLDKKAGK